MGYHVFTGLGKHLGIDPITLGVVDDRGFSITNDQLSTLKSIGIRIFRFLRHHFRDSIAGRISFLHSDLVITDASNHAIWEALTESESLTVIRGFEQLIKMEGSGDTMEGGVNKIIMDDINAVFKGNEWVVARWVSDPEFSENLYTFNERRQDIRQMGLNGFIQENNPIAFNRFSKVLIKSKDRLSLLLLDLHNDLDLSALTLTDSDEAYLRDVMNFFNDYLRNEGYLVHAGSVL